MYNFIVNLFSEEDYSTLLEEDIETSKDKSAKVLIVPSSFPNDLPFIINKKEIDKNSLLNEYPATYFNLNKFIRPTHNNANNIGINSALMSHSPTHYKITKAFIDKDDDGKTREYPNGNIAVKIPLKKVEWFENSVRETEYYKQFPELCDRVASFFRDFDVINPENSFGLVENDFIVFLVNNSDIERYLNLVDDYTMEKILKYPIFEGDCDVCGKSDQLYMLTQGNIFDLGKGRKFLFRHPTRYKTNLTSKSPENFNICKKCAKQVYNFFEYIKKYKFYTYVLPTSVTVGMNDYRNYSSKPENILEMLKNIYKSNRSQEFDYVMMITNPKIEGIEFIYVNNFNYKLYGKEPTVNINDIPIFSTLKKFTEEDDKERFVIDIERSKTIFLKEINFIFNNTLAYNLFKTNIDSLHPTLKLLISEYNSIVKNFIFFQDNSLFSNRLYSKLFRKLLSELITNSNFQKEMWVTNRKLQEILTIYYKYLNMEPGGEEKIMKYMRLKEKMDAEDFKVENDFEASYYMGQMFRYLLQNYEGQNKLSAFTACIMNVHDMDRLKKQLVEILEKYSYNKYLDNNKRFGILMSNVLSYKFENSYENNKIPLFTGYFDNNCLYASKKKNSDTKQE